MDMVLEHLFKFLDFLLQVGYPLRIMMSCHPPVYSFRQFILLLVCCAVSFPLRLPIVVRGQSIRASSGSPNTTRLILHIARGSMARITDPLRHTSTPAFPPVSRIICRNWDSGVPANIGSRASSLLLHTSASQATFLRLIISTEYPELQPTLSAGVSYLGCWYATTVIFHFWGSSRSSYGGPAFCS